MKRLIKAILIFLGAVTFWIGVAHISNLYKDTIYLIANIALVGGVVIYLIWIIYELIGEDKTKTL